MIRLENINKSFNGQEVLRNISLCFDQGKTNLIIGRSGSGKTVLLKAIVGLHGNNKDRNFSILPVTNDIKKPQ